MSKSYFNKNVTPDSKFIQNVIIDIAKKVKKYKITTTVGGSLSSKTVMEYVKSKKLINLIKRLETRKVILPSKNFMSVTAINDALKFEKTYILFKHELHDLKSESEKNRLAILTARR